MQQDPQEHRRRAEHLEALLQEISTFSDAQARATTEDLLKTLLDLHGEGLARMLEITTEHLPAESVQNPENTLVEAFANDGLVGSLLLLHGLHPLDLQTRIVKALEEIRPYLKTHHGNVELIGLNGGVAHLRLQSSCNSCPSSTSTLQSTIEDAIYKAAPDLDEIQIENVVELAGKSAQPARFVPPKRRKVQESTALL